MKYAARVDQFIAAPNNYVSIMIRNQNIGDEEVTRLADALRNNNTITQIYLDGNKITDAGASALAAALIGNNKLTHLDLKRNKIGDEGAAAIGQSLAGNHALTTLELQQNKIGDAGATVLGQGLTENHTLTMLELQQNKIGDVGAAAIGQGLAGNDKLTSLNLEQNKIGDAGVAALGQGLTENHTLTCLNLSGNQIGDAGASGLGQGLAGNGKLAQLHLSSNQIGDAGAAGLGQGLTGNGKLAQLHLSGNQIGDAGAAAIGLGLTSNYKLMRLDLDQNHIGDAGAAAIGQALVGNDKLTSLYLDQNQIGDVGAIAIGQGLSGNGNLMFLHLHQNHIGDAGAIAIGQGLVGNDKLTRLYLYQNKIGDAGAAAIGQGLVGNDKLMNLYLYQNQISAEMVTQLQQQLVKIKNFHISRQSMVINRQEDTEPVLKGLEPDFNFTGWQLILNNDIDLLQQWIDAGVDLDQLDRMGRNLLWKAAFLGKAELVNVLLKHTVNITVTDHNNCSILAVAENLLYGAEIAQMIQVSILADAIYACGEFGELLTKASLTIDNELGVNNRRLFLERVEFKLRQAGINELFASADYDNNIRNLVGSNLPDYLVEELIHVIDDLHLQKANTLHATLGSANINLVQTALSEVNAALGSVSILLEQREVLVNLMVLKPELSQPLRDLQNIILQPELKSLLAELLYCFDSLTPNIIEVIKHIYKTPEAAARILQPIDQPNLQMDEYNGDIGAVNNFAPWQQIPQQQEDDTDIIREYNPIIEVAEVFPSNNAGVNAAENQETIINISELMRDGYGRLQADCVKKGILLLGNTGAGKSTLAHILSGKQLKAVIDDETGELLVELMYPVEDIVIGNEMESDTTMPNKFHVGDLLIWESLLGFDETNTGWELANSFYIERLFETTEQLKFVLVILERDIIGANGKDFIKTVQQFINTFDNINLLAGSISLVITQTAPHKNLGHIKNSITKILTQSPQVTEEIANFVRPIMDSSLHLFHKPTGEGEMPQIDLLAAIDASTDYIITKPNMANLTISVQAIEYAAELLQTANNNFNELLTTIVESLAYANKCLSGEVNILDDNYALLVQPLLPKQGVTYPDLNKHNAEEYFIKINHLKVLQDSLNQIVVTDHESGVIAVENMLHVLAEYATSNPDNLVSNKIYEYSYVLRQQFEYIKFFGKVCGQEFPDFTVFQAIIAVCGTRLTEQLLQEVTGIVLDQHHDQGYYIEAIEHLQAYDNYAICKNNIAKANNALATLADNNEEAIEYYIQSIKSDHQLPDTYEKLGVLFFQQGNYRKAIECYKVINNSIEINTCFKKWIAEELKDPDIMMARADYFASIGTFNSAVKYYHHAASLSQDTEFKAEAVEKIANILDNQVDLASYFHEMAQNHNFFNFDLVTDEFVASLMGDS